MPFERGPDESEGSAGLSRRAAGARPTCRATTSASSPRSSMRRRCRSTRCVARARELRGAGRRRDRPRLPARTCRFRISRTRCAAEGGGLRVSVDSADPQELRRGARAGADFLLSLTEAHARRRGRTRGAAGADPGRARRSRFAGARGGRRRAARGIALPARPDPRSDPFRLHRLAARYAELRARLPDAEILMGTGNLTELTDADSRGVTAVLLGICSELAHPQRAGRAGQPAHAAHRRGARRGAAHDVCRARRSRACRAATAPRCCRCTTARRFPDARQEIAAVAAEVSDAQFPHRDRRGRHPRLQPRRARMRRATRSRCFPKLGVETDGAHAFYLGAELMKAEIACGSASATRRTSRSTGAAARRARRARIDAPGRGRPHAAGKARRADADDPRDASSPRSPPTAASHIAPLGLIAEAERLDHRAVPAVDDARQSARGAVRGRELHRRRARVRRLPDRAARLAARARARASRCRGWRQRSRMRSWRWSRVERGRSAPAFPLPRRAIARRTRRSPASTARRPR